MKQPQVIERWLAAVSFSKNFSHLSQHRIQIAV